MSAESPSSEAAPDRVFGLSRRSACVVLLVLVNFLIFLPVLGHDFINLDDNEYVTGNAAVISGFNLDSLRWAFTTSAVANWHPLTWLSHMLDCQLFGLWPAGHHASSLVLHIINALLLCLCLQRLTQSWFLALSSALLFSAHPLHVESVAWISERKDLLSTLFIILSIMSYQRYVEAKRADRASWPALLQSLFCFALSLMSKPMFVTLPCLLVLLDLWPLNRMASGRDLGRMILEKWPYFLLVPLSIFMTVATQLEEGDLKSLEQWTLWQRLGHAMIRYGDYLWLTVWPHKLAIIHPHDWSPPGLRAWLSAALVIAISLAACLTLRSKPAFFVGWFWFLGTLTPVIGIVQFSDHSIAERYTYFPHVGLFLALLALIPESVRSKRSCWTALGLLILLLGARAHVHNWTFRDSETLFRDVLKSTENNHVAHNNLGQALYARGQTEEALQHFLRAVDIRPGNTFAQLNAGVLLGRKGEYKRALKHFETVIKYDPVLRGQAHSNLANMYVRQRRPNEAIAHYKEALKINPKNARAHYNLALVLKSLGQSEQAQWHYQLALKFNPKLASPR